MWNDEQYLTWKHITKLFHYDLECGLHLAHKLTNNHVNSTRFSVMNVRLAAQVLSGSVSKALEVYGPPEAAGTAFYCQMFDNFLTV